MSYKALSTNTCYNILEVSIVIFPSLNENSVQTHSSLFQIHHQKIIQEKSHRMKNLRLHGKEKYQSTDNTKIGINVERFLDERHK